MIELEILKLRIVPQQGKNTVKLMKNLDFYASIERTMNALVSDTDLIYDIGRAYQEIQTS